MASAPLREGGIEAMEKEKAAPGGAARLSARASFLFASRDELVDSDNG